MLATKRKPVPKPTWFITYESAFDDFDETLLVVANECKRDPANPRAVIADGVVIVVGGRITYMDV